MTRWSYLIDGRGSRRRLRALVAIGWPVPELAHRLGQHRATVNKLIHADKIDPEQADAIARLYDRIAYTLPPTTTLEQQVSVDRARRFARSRHWTAPLGWDDIDTDRHAPSQGTNLRFTPDEMAIDLVVSGIVVPLRAAERKEAVRRLHAKGRTDPEMAALLGITTDGVARHRNRLGLPCHSTYDEQVA